MPAAVEGCLPPVALVVDDQRMHIDPSPPWRPKLYPVRSPVGLNAVTQLPERGQHRVLWAYQLQALSDVTLASQGLAGRVLASPLWLCRLNGAFQPSTASRLRTSPGIGYWSTWLVTFCASRQPSARQERSATLSRISSVRWESFASGARLSHGVRTRVRRTPPSWSGRAAPPGPPRARRRP
jgi:hypothetical protein